MKYHMEFMTMDKELNTVDDISKDFDDLDSAHDDLERLIDNVKPGLRVTWKKVFPVVTCECGEEVVCMNFTNTCNCGADYNFAGSLLAPRSQWGEETGETWTECY